MEGTCNQCAFPLQRSDTRNYNTGTTCLMHAAFKGRIRCVRELVSAGADVNISDSNGFEALSYAAVGGQLEAARSLGIKTEADVNETMEHEILENTNDNSNQGVSGTESRCSVKKTGADVSETIEHEYRESEDVNNNFSEGASRTELGHELEQGLPEECLSRGSVNNDKLDNELEISEEKQEGADVNRRDEEKAKGEIMSVNQKGADVNKSGLDVNHDACLRLLLASEADVNISVNQEWLALNKFAFTGNYKCVELLIRAGASVNRSVKNGFTPLIDCVASTRDDCEYLRQCVEPLYVPAFHNHCKTLDLLIRAGAGVNTTDVNGHTALIFAAANGYDDCVDLLTEAGADVNRVTKEGNTALHHSAKANYLHTVIKLLRAGAKINMINNTCHNALQHTVAMGDARRHQNVLMTLHAAGEILTRSQVKVGADSSHPVPEYLLHQDEKLDLKHICREAIRRHFILIDPHEHLLDRIPLLQTELPTFMIEYLLYNVCVDDHDDEPEGCRACAIDDNSNDVDDCVVM